MSSNRRLTLVIGGVALASLALLAYTLTRPTKEKRRSSKGRRTSAKTGKFIKKYNKKPIECHLVMSDELGFNAHVAADKKNKASNLKYGARLISINGRRVEDHTYEEIFNLLTKAKLPITLKFREFPELEQRWLASEILKDAANVLYKKGEIAAGVAKVTEAIALHNTNKTYYSNRVLMYLKSKHYELALVDCQKIRELDPKSVFIKGHYLRGLVLFNLQKYKNATSAFQTVIKLNPNFKQASIRLNECLRLLENENKEHKRRRSSEHEELKKALLNNNNNGSGSGSGSGNKKNIPSIFEVTPMKSKVNMSEKVLVSNVNVSEIKDESVSEQPKQKSVVSERKKEVVVVDSKPVIAVEVVNEEVVVENEEVVDEEVSGKLEVAVEADVNSSSNSVVVVDKPYEEFVAVEVEEDVQIEEIPAVVSEEVSAEVEVVVDDVEVKAEAEVEIVEDVVVNEVKDVVVNEVKDVVVKEVKVVVVNEMEERVEVNVENVVEDNEETIVNISSIVNDDVNIAVVDVENAGKEMREENLSVVESSAPSMNSSSVSVSIEAFMEK